MIGAYAIDRTKWAKLSIFEQMGNIYSEVGRSFTAKSHQDIDSTNNAIFRATDLFDATITILGETKSPKLHEVQTAKAQYLTVINDASATDKEIEDLDTYFKQFAIAARLQR